MCYSSRSPIQSADSLLRLEMHGTVTMKLCETRFYALEAIGPKLRVTAIRNCWNYLPFREPRTVLESGRALPAHLRASGRVCAYSMHVRQSARGPRWPSLVMLDPFSQTVRLGTVIMMSAVGNVLLIAVADSKRGQPSQTRNAWYSHYEVV